MRSALLFTLLLAYAPLTWPQVQAPFLAQKRFVLAGQEWNREITTKSGGPAKCLVSAPGRVAITVVADRSYQAMRNDDRSKLFREDVLLSVDATNSWEATIDFRSPGSYWFIIQNQHSEAGELALSCFSQS